jgi:hypothetical protein
MALAPGAEGQAAGFVGQDRALSRWHAHDTHVSVTRMVLEGSTLALRVRLFHDDLTRGLRRYSGTPDLQISPGARADSLFAAYFGRTVKLEADGHPVALRVTGSGVEQDEAAQQVVWYVLEGRLDRPPAHLILLNALLFESFRDQQNIVQLLTLPGEYRRTLYFTASDPREQAIDLGK